MAGTESEDEIRKVLDEMTEALNAGDAPRLRTMLSQRPDAIHIGTDAEEWWTSKEVVEGVAAAGGGDEIQVVTGDVGIHVAGDIAWAEGRARFRRADGAERPVRMTGVFVREDGHWKSVQSHASIGVPNADIFS